MFVLSAAKRVMFVRWVDGPGLHSFMFGIFWPHYFYVIVLYSTDFTEINYNIKIITLFTVSF